MKLTTSGRLQGARNKMKPVEETLKEIKSLEIELNATKEEIDRYIEVTREVCSRGHGGGDARECLYEEPTGEVFPSYRYVPDEERRLNAVKNLGNVVKEYHSKEARDLLKRAYHCGNSGYGCSGSSDAVKKEAGKILGYSKIRMWMDYSDISLKGYLCCMPAITMLSAAAGAIAGVVIDAATTTVLYVAAGQRLPYPIFTCILGGAGAAFPHLAAGIGLAEKIKDKIEDKKWGKR